MRRRVVALLVAALAAVLGAGGCLSVGREVRLVEGPGASPPEARTIKLATFNLYNRPWDREVRLRRAREELLALDADVVALQEVSEGWLAGADAKPMLAELPYPYQAYFMLERWGPWAESGLYLLSRWPIESASGTVHAVNRAFNRKGFLSATVRAPGVALRIVDLHQASTRSESITRPQSEAVCLALPAPGRDELLVVLGDFNAELTDAPVQRILSCAGLVAAQGEDPTAPRSWAPYGETCSAADGERIDHVLVGRPGAGQPWRVVRQGVVQPTEPPPSDHCIVWAEIAREGQSR